MAVPVLVGAAVLDPNVLVDSLVPDVIDGLREDLQPQFGVRAYRVYRLIRTWSGARVGEGTITVNDGAEVRHQPLVAVWEGMRFAQGASGVEELGEMRLTEVSLTYTYAQLTGAPLARNQEAFIAIGEAHGQGNPIRLFTHTKPPFVDRVKDLGWVVWLREVKGASWLP